MMFHKCVNDVIKPWPKALCSLCTPNPGTSSEKDTYGSSWSDDRTYAEATRIKISQLEEEKRDLINEVSKWRAANYMRLKRLYNEPGVTVLINALKQCRRHAQNGDDRGSIVTVVNMALAETLQSSSSEKTNFDRSDSGGSEDYT
jgi:hypothetical protein